MNALDRLIGWVSPVRGVRRARARSEMQMQARRYEGAAAGRRLDGWRTQGASANSELTLSLPKLRDRHRDLVRNNPWVARAVQAIVSNTVGYGITAKIAGTDRARKLWKAWAESTDCDADGRHDIYGLQALINRTIVESGEVLIRRRWRRQSDGYVVPMQLQVLEPDYLDSSKNGVLPNGGWMIQGVQFTPFGLREGYWLFQSHPGDALGFTQLESVFVPASEIAHVFKCERPGQARGVPWGAPVIVTMRDLDDYEDAYLFRQKIANCQVGVISDDRDIGSELPAASPTQQLGESFEPGRYDFLPAGKKITFNTPPSAGDYGQYTKDVLLRVAAAYGITFQALTGDLSTVNFSSGRMGWLEMQRNIEGWRWHMLIPQGLNVIAGWWKEAIEIGVGVPAKNVTITWTPPRREMIDPTKEVDAQVASIRAGLTSLQDTHRQNGEDSEEVLAQIADDNKRIDELGLTLDSDPRKTARAGSSPAASTDTTPPQDQNA